MRGHQRKKTEGRAEQVERQPLGTRQVYARESTRTYTISWPEETEKTWEALLCFQFHSKFYSLVRYLFILLCIKCCYVLPGLGLYHFMADCYQGFIVSVAFLCLSLF